jgi:hypothetical protein
MNRHDAINVGCVTSSPLTLSFDLSNATATDAAWPIITNTDALAVSQSYHGAFYR